MNRIDRLLGMLTFLQSKKFVPAEKIAEHFGISIRTVYRDIKALCEQGIPISFEPKKGYFVVSGYFLPPLMFSNEEANALLLLESLAGSLSDRSVQKYYNAALDKVKAVLRGSQKEQMEILAQKIKAQFPASLKNDYSFLSILQENISARRIIELIYKNLKEETSKRLVEPVGLIFYDFNWHLIGWCHLRKDYRDFRVSRIQHIKITDAPFEQRSHPALSEFMEHLPVNY